MVEINYDVELATDCIGFGEKVLMLYAAQHDDRYR